MGEAYLVQNFAPAAAGPPLGTQENPATSALAILAENPSAESGVYYIDTGTDGVLPLYCDMTTDGGGFMKIFEYTSRVTSTGLLSTSNLQTLSVESNSKLSDASIRSLAAGENRFEWMYTIGSTIYICRYTSSDWSNWSTTGATNMAYASKNSSGTWSGYSYNGHFNNRGFSTYSDNNGSACPITFSGSAIYATPNHTSGYSVGHPASIYVR